MLRIRHGVATAAISCAALSNPEAHAFPPAVQIVPPQPLVSMLPTAVSIGATTTTRAGTPALVGQNLVFTAANGLPSTFYDLLSGLGGPPTSTPPTLLNLQVVTYGLNGVEAARAQYSGLTAAELDIPALDTSVPGPGQMSATLGFQGSSMLPAGGTTYAPTPAPAHRWLPSAFALRIDGTVLQGTKRIEPIALKAPPQPGTQAYGPDVVFTVPFGSSQSLTSWYQDYVTRGAVATARHSISIDLLGDDGSVMFRLACGRALLYKLTNTKVAGAPYWQASAATEACQFTYTGAATQ